MEWFSHRGCEAAESPRKARKIFRPNFLKAGSALVACETIIHRSRMPKACGYNSRTYSCICLVAEREGRIKSGNLENSTQNTLHIQHRESTKINIVIL